MLRESKRWHSIAEIYDGNSSHQGLYMERSDMDLNSDQLKEIVERSRGDKLGDHVEVIPTCSSLPIVRARYWVQAVEYQARRVMALHAVPLEEQTSREMEEQFLLNATCKAIRWLDKARKTVPKEVKQQITVFERAIGLNGATKMRNCREHDEKIDLSKGKNRQENRKKTQHVLRWHDLDIEISHQLNIIHRDDGSQIGNLSDNDGLRIRLGGRVDVDGAHRAAERLATFLTEIENRERPDNPVPVRLTAPKFPPDDASNSIVTS